MKWRELQKYFEDNEYYISATNYRRNGRLYGEIFIGRLLSKTRETYKIQGRSVSFDSLIVSYDSDIFQGNSLEGFRYYNTDGRERISGIVYAEDKVAILNWDKYKAVMKRVGTYQVKVYDENEKLVWTSPLCDAYSGRIHWEDWSGIDQNSEQVPDGRYKMVVEVKDF